MRVIDVNERVVLFRDIQDFCELRDPTCDRQDAVDDDEARVAIPVRGELFAERVEIVVSERAKLCLAHVARQPASIVVDLVDGLVREDHVSFFDERGDEPDGDE